MASATFSASAGGSGSVGGDSATDGGGAGSVGGGAGRVGGAATATSRRSAARPSRTRPAAGAVPGDKRDVLGAGAGGEWPSGLLVLSRPSDGSIAAGVSVGCFGG